MARKKLIRFGDNANRENILEDSKEFYIHAKDNWRTHFFKNENPIVLELACGRGEYSVGLGAIYKDKNFIGIDVKGDRIWVGSTEAIEKGLTNVAFLRSPILDIEKFFGMSEVDEIWIVFPDPRPKKRDIKRRLTSPRFLEIYRRILRNGGWVRLKTDNTQLYEYTLALIQSEVEKGKASDLEHTNELYTSPLYEEHHQITTKYERIWKENGETIKYIKFRLLK